MKRNFVSIFSAIAAVAFGVSVCKGIAESVPGAADPTQKLIERDNARLQKEASGNKASGVGGGTSAQRETASKSGDTKPVLPPDQFFGKAQAGYEAAKQSPEVCAKLFCYCGCDLTDAHTSLLDCFTSDHGADCEICQDEAIVALDLKKKGKTIAQIQQYVDQKWIKEYPFDKPSRALQTYRSSRLYQPAAAEQGKGSHSLMLPPQSAKPHVLPGKKVGDCCGAKSKHK